MWKKSIGGSFSVRACYEHISVAREVPGPWKDVWYKAVPFKVQFFMWTALLEKISNMNMLQRKGFFLPNICLLCYQDAESVSLLLLHCPFSWEIWCGIARVRSCPYCSLVPVLPSSRLENLSFHSFWWKDLEVGPCCCLLGNLVGKEQSGFQILFKTSFSGGQEGE